MMMLFASKARVIRVTPQANDCYEVWHGEGSEEIDWEPCLTYDQALEMFGKLVLEVLALEHSHTGEFMWAVRR